VYKSIDGGVTFTPMSNGLPPTLVNEIVASPDERFIFAATEAGPYVYVANENMWYSLSDNTMPTQFYSGVEYVNALNTVRFSTMGRGIWDFVITGTIPVTLSRWQAEKKGQQVDCTWQTDQEINTASFTVQRSADGTNFTDMGSITATGNSSIIKNYIFTDQLPLKGINYYRLRTNDRDGRSSLSKIIAIRFDGTSKGLFVYPNPARQTLFIETGNSNSREVVVAISDATGRVVMHERRMINGQSAFSVDVQALPKGNYVLAVKGIDYSEVVKFIKQ
jgi:hypothetical protein